MSSVTRYGGQEGWTGWVNASTTERLPRIVGSTDMKLPFSIFSLGITEIARWSFGQAFISGLSTSVADDTGNGHTATLINSAILTETGLSSPNRNGYATVADGGDLNYPQVSPTTLMISCWIKSNITDYSSKLGVIAAWHNGVPDVPNNVGYMLYIDTDNIIKGAVHHISTTRVFSSEITIDTSWHHLLFVVPTAGGGNPIYLFVDNEDIIEGVLGTFGTVVGAQFSIGSSVIDDSCGFSGIIDELSLTESNITTDYALDLDPTFRFEPSIFLSPVVDTERENSILSGILATLETPNGANVRFSFRASDTLFTQTSTDIEWTGFTTPEQIITGSISNLSDLGLYVKGRYHQIRVRMAPSNTNSPVADDLQLDTPVVNTLEINTGVTSKLLVLSNPAFEPGTIRAQLVNFSGARDIHKASLNLTVVNADKREFVVGQSGDISFQAANFQDGRDTWAFQPVINWGEPSWESSGTTIQNTFQQEFYETEDDVIINAPFLQYRIFFPAAGTYDLWGYGYTESVGVAYWAFDRDDSNIRSLILGDDSTGWESVPKWTKFGTFYVGEGGVHSFEVYLGLDRTVLLDQWYFTTDLDTENVLADAGLDIPLPLSKAPFNTALRLRTLIGGGLDSLSTPSSGGNVVTSWLSSTKILASGKFNYEIREFNANNKSGVIFDDGLSMEYWQIGGDTDFFASWDYTFPTNSVGQALTSINNGQTFTND